MSTCFCGCGTEIGLFDRERRRANESGAKLAKMLSDFEQYYKPWLDDGRPGFVEPTVPNDAPDPLEHYRTTVAEGTAMRDGCLACVHEIPGPDAPGKRAVNSWVKSNELLIQAVRMPLESRQKFFHAVQHGTPEEIMNAHAEGVKLTR